MKSLKEIINHVNSHTATPGKCLISFSGGKDAWSCELALRDHIETHLFAYYLVPGLEVVDEYLDYCERKTGKKIYRFPSPLVYERIAKHLYQPPERVPAINAANIPKVDFDDVTNLAREMHGLDETTWCAIGVRAADSIARSTAIRAHGSCNDKRRTFYPVWDWKKADVIAALKKHDVKLSVEYRAYGRTFDGLFLLYALNTKNMFPRDYQKILEYFPFVELEIFRYEKALERYGGVGNLPKNVVDPTKKVNKKMSFGFMTKKNEKKKEHKYSNLRAETKRTDLKMQSIVYPEFWISVYFPDSSRFQVVFEDAGQQDFFLKQLKLFSHGDKYLDGRYVAQKLGIEGFDSYSLFQKIENITNPLGGIEITDNPEQDCCSELRAFVDNTPKARKFEGSQAELFLSNANWPHEKGNCWCHDIAELLGIALPETYYYYRPFAPDDPKLLDLVD